MSLRRVHCSPLQPVWKVIMSAPSVGTQLLEARSNARSSRTLFALLAAAHLVKAFWSLEHVLVAELVQNLSVTVALALFAANFHLTPRKSLPYRMVWLAVMVAVVAIAVDILVALKP